MVIIYNLSAGLLALVAAGVAAALHLGAGMPWKSTSLLAGFTAMLAGGLALELGLRRERRPRYFFLVPAWLAGLVGVALTVRQAYDERAGDAFLGVAALATIGLLAREYRKPGGSWLLAIIGEVLGVTALQIAMDQGYRPVWAFVVNGALMVALIGCGIQLWRVRRRAARAAAAATASAAAPSAP